MIMQEENIEIFAFVLMPFEDKFDDIYKLGIKEIAEKLGIKAERVDEQNFREGILERIYRQIEAADLIIADMSGQNPNVFYEVGYAHAKDKLCILMTEDVEDIPFDLQNYRHIIYGQSIDGLRKNLMDELTWAKEEIEKMRSSRVKVQLEADGTGNLEKTSYNAKGTIDFELDLHNEYEDKSAEIDAIYFYSTDEWTFYQDGNECPSSDSDIPEYEARHFLKPPVRRLNPGGWTQLKFKARKTLAWATEGEELKDSYPITGHSLVRLDTDKGNYDYNVLVDVRIVEIPF